MATVYISIGSNIDKEKNIPSAIEALTATFGTMTLSSLYRCDSIGFDGPEFFNMVVGFETAKPVEALLDICKQMEIDHGRELNAAKFTPRPLDLDILLYNDIVIDSPTIIPRPEIKDYAFVLWPLAEIAGNERHPICHQSYDKLWQDFDKSTQKIQQQPYDL